MNSPLPINPPPSRGSYLNTVGLKFGSVARCLTDGGDHRPHEVEGSAEVPSRPDRVHADARYVRLLVVAQEVPELLLTQVEPEAEQLEPLRPALLRLALLGLLQRGEHGGAAQQVHDDEERQQQEPSVVVVHRTAAAAAQGHYVFVVTVEPQRGGTCGMSALEGTHSPRLLGATGGTFDIVLVRVCARSRSKRLPDESGAQLRRLHRDLGGAEMLRVERGGRNELCVPWPCPSNQPPPRAPLRTD